MLTLDFLNICVVSYTLKQPFSIYLEMKRTWWYNENINQDDPLKVHKHNAIFHPILNRLVLVIRLELFVRVIIWYSLTIDFILYYDFCTVKISLTKELSLDIFWKLNAIIFLIDLLTFALDFEVSWTYGMILDKSDSEETIKGRSDEKPHHVTAQLGIIKQTTFSLSQII